MTRKTKAELRAAAEAAIGKANQLIGQPAETVVTTKTGVTIRRRLTPEGGGARLSGGGFIPAGELGEAILDDALAHAVDRAKRVDLEQAEAVRAVTEGSRRRKISDAKKGKPKAPNAKLKATYEKADALHRRYPALTAAAILTRLERDLPVGTDLPTERQLRRRFTGH